MLHFVVLKMSENLMNVKMKESFHLYFQRPLQNLLRVLSIKFVQSIFQSYLNRYIYGELLDSINILWTSREVGRLTTKRPHNVHTTSAHISWVLRTTSTQHRHTMSTWHTVGAHNVCTTSTQRPRNVGTPSVHSRHTDWLPAGTYKVFTNRLLAGY